MICSGILDVSAPGLAVVASCPGGLETVLTFGEKAPRRRLFDLIDTETPVDFRDLVITAVPYGEQFDSGSALAVLDRHNFTFLVSVR